MKTLNKMPFKSHYYEGCFQTVLGNGAIIMNEKILKEAENVKEKTYDFDKYSFIVNSVFHENSGERLFAVLLRLIGCDTHDKQERA